MYRPKEVMRPKTKVAVALHRVDGPVLEGNLSVAGDERILDVMNSGNPFFPLEVADNNDLLELDGDYFLSTCVSITAGYRYAAWLLYDVRDKRFGCAIDCAHVEGEY